MPRPRSRQLPAGPASQAGEATADDAAVPISDPPPPGAALHVTTTLELSKGKSGADSTSSQPHSPLLMAGSTHMDASDGDSLLGWQDAPGKAGSSGAGDSNGGSIAGSAIPSTCWLSSGATAEALAEKKRVQRKLLLALGLALCFMVVEVVGGLLAHSLAIITDAAHLLSDTSGFAVAALAASWAARAAPAHFSWGYHRVEVLGALVSVLAVWTVTVNLLIEAVQRVISPEPVDGKTMFIVAVAGVVCNLLMMAVLGHHHHGGLPCSHGSGGAASAAAAAMGLAPGCGDGCCDGGAQPRRRLFFGLDAVDVELGALKGTADDEVHGSVHSGLVPILAAAGYSHDTLSTAVDGGSYSGVHKRAPGAAAVGSGLLEVPPEAAAATWAGPAAGAAGGAAGCSHANLNLRGAIVHVIGDLVQSIGVCIAGALIWWKQDDPRWALADPICTFLFAVLVLFTTAGITRDICHVLMERAPRGLSVDALRRGMEQVRGVAAVEDLHVWSLTPSIPLLCARVRLARGAPVAAALQAAEAFCASQGIRHCTIQPVIA